MILIGSGLFFATFVNWKKWRNSPRRASRTIPRNSISSLASAQPGTTRKNKCHGPALAQDWPRASQGQNHRWDGHDQRWSQMTSQYGLVFSPLIFTHRDHHFRRFFWQNLEAYKFICAVSKKFNQMSTKKTILHVRQNKFSNCSKKINNFKTLFGLWTKIFRTLTGKFSRFQR